MGGPRWRVKRSSRGILDPWLTARDSKIENRALFDRPFSPDSAIMAVNNSLHGSEADARAFVILSRVQTLKGPKQLVYVGHIEARAVIAHEKGSLALYLLRPEFDPGRAALASEFPGIIKEILEGDP